MSISSLELLHLVILFLWGGVVLAETVIEFGARTETQFRFAAKLHYRIDIFIEIPLLLGVLVTGFMLAIQVWPLSSLHLVKIAAALIAISINAYCAALVFRRYRSREDTERLRSYTREIRWAWVGVPFAFVALYIGLRYFMA